METLGVIFLVLIAVIVLAVLFVLLRSIPDIRRYQRMRNM